MTLPRKSLVVGTPISVTSYGEVLDAMSSPSRKRALTVVVCNVHSVMSARRHPALRASLEGADIATPDGMPLVWAVRWTADPGQERVYGPELMTRGLLASETNGWRHYLYGSTPETLQALEVAIAELAPLASVVGLEAPPFRELSPKEEEAAIERIRASEADIVWIGLGMPKQELWMMNMAPRLPGTALVGVGAAFDFISGTKRHAPNWMQRAGLEWLFRLTQEPRRLWRRYLWNNPAYLVLLGRQIVSERLRPRSSSSDEGPGRSGI